MSAKYSFVLGLFSMKVQQKKEAKVLVYGTLSLINTQVSLLPKVLLMVFEN